MVDRPATAVLRNPGERCAADPQAEYPQFPQPLIGGRKNYRILADPQAAYPEFPESTRTGKKPQIRPNLWAAYGWQLRVFRDPHRAGKTRIPANILPGRNVFTCGMRSRLLQSVSALLPLGEHHAYGP